MYTHTKSILKKKKALRLCYTEERQKFIVSQETCHMSSIHFTPWNATTIIFWGIQLWQSDRQHAVRLNCLQTFPACFPPETLICLNNSWHKDFFGEVPFPRKKEKISYTKFLKIRNILLWERITVETSERNLVKLGSLYWTAQTKDW